MAMTMASSRGGGGGGGGVVSDVLVQRVGVLRHQPHVGKDIPLATKAWRRASQSVAGTHPDDDLQQHHGSPQNDRQRYHHFQESSPSRTIPRQRLGHEHVAVWLSV